MTLRSVDHALVGPVCAAIAAALAHRPIKQIARDLGASLPTCSRLKRGEAPSLPVLLAAFCRYGAPFVAQVLGTVLDRGPFDVAATLSRLNDTLTEARHDLARLQDILAEDAAASPVAAGARLLGKPAQMLQGGAGAVARSQALEPAGPGRAAAAAGRRADAPSLVSTRRGLDALTAEQRRVAADSLAAFAGGVSLGELVARARAAGNVSLAFRPANDPHWKPLYLGRLNRIVPRDLIGRPYVEHPDAAYGASIQRSFEAVTAPAVVDLDGTVSAPHPVATRARVFRFPGGKASTGEQIVGATLLFREDLARSAA